MRLALAFATAALVASAAEAKTVDEIQNCPAPAARLKPIPPTVEGVPVPASLRGAFKMVATIKSPTDRKACAGIDSHRPVPGKDKGGVRFGIVAKATKPIAIYRAYGKAATACSTARLEGSWWAAKNPVNASSPDKGKGSYRRKNGICQSWNDLGRIVKCTLKKDAIVVLGPTQSVSKATCGCPVLNKDRKPKGSEVAGRPFVAKDSYPVSNDWQAYINVFGVKLSDLMTCDAPSDW